MTNPTLIGQLKFRERQLNKKNIQVKLSQVMDIGPAICSHCGRDVMSHPDLEIGPHYRSKPFIDSECAYRLIED